MSDVSSQPLTDWVCHVTPDVDVRLEDVPGVEWDEICRTYDKAWFWLASNPLVGTGGQAQDIYALCCRIAGVESRVLTSRELYNAFDKAPDDRPVSYTGGFPDPKADEQTTPG